MKGGVSMFYKDRFIQEVLKKKVDVATEDYIGVIERTLDYILDVSECEDFELTSNAIRNVLGTEVNPMDYHYEFKVLTSCETYDELVEWLISYFTHPILQWNGEYFNITDVVIYLGNIMKEYDRTDSYLYIVGDSETLSLDYTCTKYLELINLDKRDLKIRVDWDNDSERFTVYRIY